MGTTVDDWGGWIVFIGTYDGNTKVYKIRCESQPELDLDDPSAFFMDNPSDSHFAWSLGSRKRIIKIKDIWFTTTARFEEFMAFLEAAQDAGTLEIRIQIKSGALTQTATTTQAGNTTIITGYYHDWDGGNHYTMPVLWEKPRGIKKVYNGSAEIWKISQLTLRQSDDLKTWRG